MTNVEDRLRALGDEASVAPEFGAVVKRGERIQYRRRNTRRGAMAVAAVCVFGLAWSGYAFGLRGLSEPTTLGQAAVQPSDDRLHPAASDPVFTGLPGAVVAEVLSNPAAQANIDMPISAEDRTALWQGMVLNFVMCRQELDIYRTWTATGAAPKTFPSPPRPANPTGSYADFVIFYRNLRTLVDSHDPARLRADLLLDAGCGRWIPATPGDVTGPTIADVVSGMPTD